jgi:hypothetical protein
MDHVLSGTREAASVPTPPLSVGGLFIEALARRDFAGLAGPRRLVEQHVFAASRDRISALDLLCSGFVTPPNTTTYQQGRTPCLERQ